MKDYKSIDAYIKDFPADIQEILQKIRQTIKSAAPEAQEAIRYGMPTFRFKDKNMVHFAAFTKHIGFYPTPTGVAQFKEDMAKYSTGKGTMQFPLDQPIPYDVITKISAFRYQELQDKA